jgi:hypothetical protein
MLTIRYAAFFAADRTNPKLYSELALSLMTLDRHVAPYLDLVVRIHTIGPYVAAAEKLCANFSFRSEVVALDRVIGGRFEENAEFANSLSNLTEVDRFCVIRMLSDFALLDDDGFRLLIGTDIFFLDCPQEVFAFVWGPGDGNRVLYMQDLHSFSGAEYGIRYYHPPALPSLLGDFYCLAPGVKLSRSAITGCLKMIDVWPTSPSRFVPPTDGATAPEQQAAAILLQRFGGEALPAERYAHIRGHSDLAVLHTHDIAEVFRRLGPWSIETFQEITGFKVEIKGPEASK